MVTTKSTTPKRFTRGTHRLVDPAETAARVLALSGPLGITRVAHVTGLDCIGIPVVQVCRPNSRSLAVSQGKGTTLDAARASGLMEAAELFHAERIGHPLKLGSWNDLRFSHELVRVEALPRVSVSPFHPDYSLLWIAGMDLFTSRPLWLPFELVHNNFTMPFPTGSGCFVMSSNGLASGNHPLEAISHGLCEVIERDAAALFRLHPLEQQARLRVDLSTITDPECVRLLRRFDEADVEVAVWDMTSDIGIATFKAVILDRGSNPFRVLGPVEGMGTHPVREVALLRALTEAAQGRLTLIAGSRDDNGRGRYAETQQAELIEHARRRLAETATRAFDATPSYENDSFEEDLVTLTSGLQKAGLDQAIVVDLTKPEFAIPVVRVVVPGLEPYHHVPGYVPGPRARALLERQRKEAAS
ncbi:MAG: YcaO-like family protein [Myxococcales bacterium]|nr:YcaO-like family protein [Myxococcales bacterium]